MVGILDGGGAVPRCQSGINRAQMTCFDSKIMAQPCVFIENSFKFLDQNDLRA